MACRSSATVSADISLALCGVELGLHGDEVWLAEREADVPVKRRIQGSGGIGRGDRTTAPLVEEPLADIEQHLRQDGFLPGEVPVDPGTGHSNSRPDANDGVSMEAVAGKQDGRRCKDLLAP